MSFEWKREEIRSRLTQLLNSLIKIAMEDEIVSEDEQAIIDTLSRHILAMEDEFSQMTTKHYDMEMATNHTRELFEKAIEATVRQAKQDGTITADELILIDRLTKSLRREELSKYLQ